MASTLYSREANRSGELRKKKSTFSLSWQGKEGEPVCPQRAAVPGRTAPSSEVLPQSILLCPARVSVFLGESCIWWICLLKETAKPCRGFLTAGTDRFWESRQPSIPASACLGSGKQLARCFGLPRRGWREEERLKAALGECAVCTFVP